MQLQKGDTPPEYNGVQTLDRSMTGARVRELKCQWDQLARARSEVAIKESANRFKRIAAEMDSLRGGLGFFRGDGI